MKPLSILTEKFTESVIREMTRVCDAVDGYNLSQGFPDFACPSELKEAATRAINEDFNQYPVTYGEPEFREAIAMRSMKFNHIECNPDTNITVTCGATEAMIAALKAIINPGDEIIIFEPFYENYGPDGILSGAIPRYVTLHLPDWSIDFDELKQTFNKNTKAVIINTPNNPTGKVFSHAELEYIARLCQEWDAYAVTDEIYEHLTYDGAEHVSIASLPGMSDRTITINSLSKTYSVTGWRVGWAIASNHITERIRKVHDFLTVGAPTPLQHAGIVALHLPDNYYKKLKNDYFEKRNYLFDTLNKNGFIPYLPKGSYYMMADFTNLKTKYNVKTDLEFSHALIEKTRVATVPGFSFYSSHRSDADVIRFTFCKKWTTLNRVRELFESNLL